MGLTRRQAVISSTTVRAINRILCRVLPSALVVTVAFPDPGVGSEIRVL
jgi:hypothetical protein